ncbi:MAG: phage tail protein I [Rhodospirillales bacterium]|nr:phage tail protein I [Rhodospirillales bacterium]
MTKSLLPPNATALELALEGVAADRVEAIPVPIPTVNDAAQCPAPVLPFLAWGRSVDVYDASWSDATKRTVVGQAMALHRIKGTLQSVVAAIAAWGIEATVIERAGARRYDGAQAHDGRCLYGPANGWAMYRVILNRAIRNDQVAGLRRLLEMTAPKRCELLSLEYQEAANLYDGRSTYDGAYNHGVAV